MDKKMTDEFTSITENGITGFTEAFSLDCGGEYYEVVHATKDDIEYTLVVYAIDETGEKWVRHITETERLS